VVILIGTLAATVFLPGPGPAAAPISAPSTAHPTAFTDAAASPATHRSLLDRPAPGSPTATAPAAIAVNDSPAYWLAGSGPEPDPRTDPAYASTGSIAAVFGGYVNGSRPCTPFATCAIGETWIRPAASGTWQNVTPATPSSTNTPSDRWGAAMAFDPAIDAFVLFGGTTAYPNGFNNPALGDTWLLSASTDTWKAACQSCVPGTSEPTARWGAASAYDPGTGTVVLFGGESTQSGTSLNLGDTWSFNGTAWAPLALSPSPSNRSGAAFAWDAERGTTGALVLFGGYPASADTWLFRDANWSAVTPTTSPPAMGGAAAATDPVNGSVLLVGGCATDPCVGGLSATAWSWANGDWHALRAASPSAPPARYDTALFEDAPNESIVLFGGDVGGAAANDTWSYLHLEAEGVRASAYTLDIGQTVSLNETADGGQGALSYRWEGLPSGCSTQDARTISCDPSGPGPFTASFRVLVSDTLGESVLSPPALVRFNADPGVIPQARPTTGVVPLQVSFSATYSGGTGAIILNWSFGDAGVGTGPAPTHTYLTAGNFTARVWANDTLGTSTEKSIPIEVIPLLRANVTIKPDPWTISTNDSVVVATASGGLPPYTFSFATLPSGCGEVSATPPTYDCRPSSPGDFAINLTVTDQSGQRAQANRTLVVLAPTTSPPARSSPVSVWDYVALAAGIAALLAVVVWSRRRSRARTPRPMTTVPVPEPHELPAIGGSLYVPPPERPPKRRP
jgi:hypothetical protein